MNVDLAQYLAHPWVKIALSFLGFGLSAGVVAKLILPGNESLGWLRTIAVGILGAVVGSVVSAYMGWGSVGIAWNLKSFGSAVGGAVLLLILNRLVTKT
jgi:uncharacterized membrane protein YeaQ/YmgE (transglycosylase-associated protein family)